MIERLELPFAQYDVVFEGPCHHYAHEIVRIEQGKETTLTGKPQKRLGAVKVKGHAGEGFFADGVQVGTAPGTFYIPVCSEKIELRQGEKVTLSTDLKRLAGFDAAVGAKERQPILSTIIPDPQDPNGVIQGSLSMQEISQVVHSHHDKISDCYSKELTSNPGLQGKINTTWTIDEEGDVTEAKVKDATFSSPSLEQCILSEIKKWKFPAPLGGGTVIVSYPFILAPAK